MSTLTARSPLDLLAVVPVVLGFEPAGSVVMLTVGAAHPFHARVDLPDVAADVGDAVDLLLQPAERHRATGAVLLIYSADAGLGRAVVRRARDRPGPPELLEVLRVHGGRWFSLLRPGPPAGVPYDVSHHPFVVDAVVQGRVLHRSREELVATLRTDPDAAARVLAAGVRHPGGPASPGWVAGAVERWTTSEDPPPDGDAARLLRAVVGTAGRDAALSGLTRTCATGHARLWQDLVRRAPAELAGPACDVLAVSAWVAGDGALAWCAVDRAREAGTEAGAGHVLAERVGDLLTAAVPPAEWEVLRRRLLTP